MKGSIVIAKKTDNYYGFKKGDTLEITDIGSSGDVYYAKNLTRPRYGGRSIAFICRSEFRVVTPAKGTVMEEVRIFGFVIYRKTFVGDSE